MSPENAAIQSSIYFTNFASKNAIDKVLKYIDNPEIKTQA